MLTLGGWAVWLEPRQRFAAGHIVEGGHHLYVATGVGTSILPVRFLVPPAVTILTLGGDARPAHWGQFVPASDVARFSSAMSTTRLSGG